MGNDSPYGKADAKGSRSLRYRVCRQGLPRNFRDASFKSTRPTLIPKSCAPSVS